MFSWLTSRFRRGKTARQSVYESELKRRLIDPLLAQIQPLGDEGLSLDAALAVANGRLKPDELRALTESHRRQLLETGGAPDALFWQNIVDPTEPIWDQTDFWLPLGFGQAVPWTLNNRLHGEVLPVYITEYGLKIIRDWSRKMVAFNEFALNAIENRISYIVGKGFQYKAVPANRSAQAFDSMDAPGSSSDAGELCRRVQAVIDEFCDRERWGEREQEAVKRADRDGEAILRFFHIGNGKTSVRFVEPELLTDQTGESNKEYGVVTDPHDIEDVEAFEIVEDPSSEWAPVEVSANEVVHIKLNTDSTSKRGLPTLFPVRKNLERADKLLRNMSIMAQVRATFAVIRKHKQFNPSSVNTYQSAQADQQLTLPVTGRALQLQQLFPGSIVDASDKTEYEFPGADVDAAGLVEILQAELRAVAARLVMPEFMLTVNANDNSFANALVSAAPSVKNFERLQVFFGRRFGDGQFGSLKTSGAMWRVIYNAVEAGLLPREALTDVEIQCEGPTVVAVDKGKETDRAEKLSNAGILSDATWSKWEGLDHEQEQKQGAKPKEKAGAPPGPGGGGDFLPPSAPPGSAGGEESGLGQFAGGLGEHFFAEAADAGRWITIGARAGENGQKRGGSRVFIKNGRIVKGAPGLSGKKIGALKEPAETGHRAELNASKEYERAKYAKQAKKEGIKPEHLHQLAGEIAAHDKAHAEERNRVVKDAKDLLTKYGYDARALTTNLRSGRVEDQIPHLDYVARTMASRYPEQFAGYGDDQERLTDLLTSGKQEVMSQAEAYEQALDHLRSEGLTDYGNEDNEGDPGTTSGDPLGDEDPFSFDFGANVEEPEEPPARPKPQAASTVHSAKVDSAWERFNSRGQNARGGGLFGGEDMQARAGFAKLPDGAPVLFTDGEFAGQTGKIVRDKENDRIVAEVDGRAGLVPIEPASIEPINPAQSWRTDTSYGPSEQKTFLNADLFLGKRTQESLAEGCVKNKAGHGFHDDQTGHPCTPNGQQQGGGDKQAGAEKQLDGEIARMNATPQGKAIVEKGKAIAAKVQGKIKEGVKSALDGIDAESGGGLSLIAGGIKGGDEDAVAAGVTRLVSVVYKCVHEEMFELLLSQQTGQPAFVAKLGAKVAAKATLAAQTATVKAAAWAMGKIRGTKEGLAEGWLMEGDKLTDADKQLLAALAGTVKEAVASIFAGAGVEGIELDDAAIQSRLFASFHGSAE